MHNSGMVQVIRLMWNEAGLNHKSYEIRRKSTKNSRNKAVFGAGSGPVSDFFSCFSFLFEAIVVQITCLLVILHQTLPVTLLPFNDLASLVAFLRKS